MGLILGHFAVFVPLNPTGIASTLPACQQYRGLTKHVETSWRPRVRLYTVIISESLPAPDLDV